MSRPSAMSVPMIAGGLTRFGRRSPLTKVTYNGPSRTYGSVHPCVRSWKTQTFHEVETHLLTRDSCVGDPVTTK